MAPAKCVGQILLLLPRRAGEGGKSGGWQRRLGPRWGLSSHCPLQKKLQGLQISRCWGKQGCPHPTGPTAAPRRCCSPRPLCIPEQKAQAVPGETTASAGSVSVFNYPPCSEPRLAGCRIAGAARESCRAQRDARSMAQLPPPPRKCCSPLGESCFSSWVCRCFIDAAALLLVSADR